MVPRWSEIYILYTIHRKNTYGKGRHPPTNFNILSNAYRFVKGIAVDSPF